MLYLVDGGASLAVRPETLLRFFETIKDLETVELGGESFVVSNDSFSILATAVTRGGVRSLLKDNSILAFIEDRRKDLERIKKLDLNAFDLGADQKGSLPLDIS